MKITGTSSYIKVETEGKIIKIDGEMVIGGFAAYTDTMTHWEPPYEDVIIDEPTKRRLINEIMVESEKYGYKIMFE